jgi:hypothetical protein
MMALDFKAKSATTRAMSLIVFRECWTEKSVESASSQLVSFHFSKKQSQFFFAGCEHKHELDAIVRKWYRGRPAADVHSYGAFLQKAWLHRDGPQGEQNFYYFRLL